MNRRTFLATASVAALASRLPAAEPAKIKANPPTATYRSILTTQPSSTAAESSGTLRSDVDQPIS